MHTIFPEVISAKVNVIAINMSAFAYQATYNPYISAHQIICVFLYKRIKQIELFGKAFNIQNSL